MTQKQRQILRELMLVCDHLGHSLDGTATTVSKYIDRQRAHRLVSDVIYGMFGDSKENDNREEDVESAEECLKKLQELANKQYPDRNGKYDEESY